MCVAIPSKILQLIVQQDKPKLTSVTLDFSYSRSLNFEDVLNSLPPGLTSSYSGLKELHIKVESSQLPNPDSLMVIFEHHCSLHTVSLGCRDPICGKLDMSMRLIKPWLKVCFTKPSLRHFKLSLSPMPTHVMMDILAMFVSTPRSQEQALIFSAMDIKSLRYNSFYTCTCHIYALNCMLVYGTFFIATKALYLMKDNFLKTRYCNSSH